MPAYVGTSAYPNIDALTTGKPSPVWGSVDTSGNLTVGETVTAGEMSQQVVVPNDEIGPRSYAVEIAFVDASGVPADPGVFECDVLHASTDSASHYVKVGQIVAVNSSFVGRLELAGVVTKFAALKMVTLSNAVKVIATFTK
jgi:hypothetical protein